MKMMRATPVWCLYIQHFPSIAWELGFTHTHTSNTTYTNILTSTNAPNTRPRFSQLAVARRRRLRFRRW